MTASPWAQARNFAVMTGVNAGIAAAMKRARGGVEDWQSRYQLRSKTFRACFDVFQFVRLASDSHVIRLSLFQNSMVSAFGSGIAFSLVSGIGGPNIGSAINTGLGFALVQGAIFQVMFGF